VFQPRVVSQLVVASLEERRCKKTSSTTPPNHLVRLVRARLVFTTLAAPELRLIAPLPRPATACRRLNRHLPRHAWTVRRGAALRGGALTRRCRRRDAPPPPRPPSLQRPAGGNRVWSAAPCGRALRRHRRRGQAGRRPDRRAGGGARVAAQTPANVRVVALVDLLYFFFSRLVFVRPFFPVFLSTLATGVGTGLCGWDLRAPPLSPSLWRRVPRRSALCTARRVPVAGGGRGRRRRRATRGDWTRAQARGRRGRCARTAFRRGQTTVTERHWLSGARVRGRTRGGGEGAASATARRTLLATAVPLGVCIPRP